MDEISFPAAVVISRPPTRKTPQPFVCVDDKVCMDLGELADRLGALEGLALLGGVPYTHTPAPAAEAAATAARIRAELEAKYCPAPVPTPTQQDPLDQAAELARQRWAGDLAMLARVARALELAKAGAVQDLGSGQYQVTGQSGRPYTVNGRCQCPDYAHNSNGGFCKHRLAVALVKRAAELKKNGALSADTPKAPELAPTSEDPTQGQDSTKTPNRQPLTVALKVEYETDAARWAPRTGAGRLVGFYLDGHDADPPTKDLDGLYRWLQGQGYTPEGFVWLDRAVAGKRTRKQVYGRPLTDEESRAIEAMGWDDEAVKRDGALPADYARGSAKLQKS